MKWLIRGAGLLVSSIIFTALRLSPLWQYLGGVAAGIIVCAVYFLGVFFIPAKVIALVDARKAARSATAPEGSVIQPNEPKRRPCTPYVATYQLVIFVLAIGLLASFIAGSSAYKELKNEMEAAADVAYREGYNDGYADGEQSGHDIGYENGYVAGCTDGYATAKEAYLLPVPVHNGEVFMLPAYSRTCPFTIKASLTLPSSGGILNYYVRLQYISADSLDAGSAFPYNQSIHEGAHYIRTPLSDSITLSGEGNDIAFYVANGRSVDIDVPPGIYKLWYCTGETWYGQQHYFGDDTQWYSSSKLLLFYSTSSEVVGNTISLYKTIGGNFTTYEVDSDELPF